MFRSTTPASRRTPAATARPSQYCYHENDGSFEGNGRTVHRLLRDGVHASTPVSTLSSRSGDTKVGQEVFYPYNATNLSGSPQNYFYYTPGGLVPECDPPSTTTSRRRTTRGSRRSTSRPTNTNDQNLYKGTNKLGAYLSNPAAATVNKYYRLEVDTLQWNGQSHVRRHARAVRVPVHRDRHAVRGAQGLLGAPGL